MAKAAGKNPTQKSAIKRQVIKGNNQTSAQSAVGVGIPQKISKTKGKGNNK